MSESKSLKKKFLITSNIITLLLLIMVSIHLFFPTIFNFSSKKKLYQDTESYKSIMSIYREQKDIVLLGSSLTSEVKWVELLNRSDIAERGLGGNTTGDMLRRMNFVYAVNPKICFVEGGINDVTRKINRDSTIKNLRTIALNLKQRNCETIFTTVSLVTSTYAEDATGLNLQIKKLDSAIINLASELNLKYIDLNSTISDGNFRKKEFASEDGLHYSGKTYLVWKEKIQEILSILEKPDHQ